MTSVHEHQLRVGAAAHGAAKGGLGLLGGMLRRMGPQAGSHLRSDDWRLP